MTLGRASLVLAWSLTGLAAGLLQPSLSSAEEPTQKVARLGFVHSQSPSTANRGLPGFWERLAELGWIRGRNLISEERCPAWRVDFPSRAIRRIG